jgi:tetratricopeptide (TPR) repeat protein
VLTYYLAEPYKRLGQIRHAVLLYERALEVDQALGDVRGVAITQNALAELLVQQGKVEEARVLYEQSLRTKQELGDVREVSVTQHALAGLLAQQGKVEEARTLYEQSLQTAQALGDVQAVATTEANLSYILFMHGEQEQGLALAWKAYQSLQTNGYLPDAEVVQNNLLSMKAADPSRFDALWTQVIHQAQPEWLRSVNVQASQEQDDPSTEVIQAVREYVNAESWDVTRQVLIRRQEILFQLEVEALFEQYIRAAQANGEQRVADILTTHLALLQACKARGIEVAFAAFMQARQLPFDETLIPRSIAALCGGPAEKMAHAQYLTEQAAHTTDEGTKELLKTIQFALFGGDISQSGSQLEGIYRWAWETIMANVNSE